MSDGAKIVWIVTSGTYSDYRYHGIFSTAEKAQEYIGKMSPQDHATEFQPVELDALEDAEMRLKYISHLDQDGNITREFTGSPVLASLRDRGESFAWGLSEKTMTFGGFAYSPEQARKLAVECRQAYLRTQAGTGHPTP